MRIPQDFSNEPFADFSQKKQQMLDAIALVQKEGTKHHPLLIGKKEVKTGNTFVSYNPSHKTQALGTFEKAGQREIELAIKEAWKAFDSWKLTPHEQRCKILQKAAALMRQRRFEMDATLVLEAGKSWFEADADTAEAIDFLEFYSRLPFDTSVVPMKGENPESHYLPLGVGSIIPPWNFPNAILVGMTAAAIVCGNTVLLKPASDTPLIAYKVMEILTQAGVPAGVVNFVPGSGSEIGDLMVDHPKIRFICFTGSKEVGLRINERAAKVHPGQIWLKRVIAEMGGKDAIIVDDEADLDAAAQGTSAAAFGYQGQKCSACSRVIVAAKIYDEFVQKLLENVRKIKMGDVADGAMDLGPVINEASFKKILSYVEVGKKEGKLLHGGKGDSSKGYFIEPTVFGDVKVGSRLEQEEIFGPILAVIKVKDYDEALKVANDTEFGLTGAVYSKDRAKLERAKIEFHVGNLYLNRKCTGAMVGVHPFGGFNMSGTDSKAGGKEYLLLFTQMKSISEKI